MGFNQNCDPWVPTPLIESQTLSEAAECRVFLKLDNLQPSGSFKSRGVGNYVRCRAAEHQGPSRPHFYAASGGNAGVACVHAARSIGCKATVVVPTTAKPAMIARLKSMGAAEVLQQGASIMEAQAYVKEKLLKNDPNGIFCPPFDHPDIWDGNATVMDEIAAQLGDCPDVVICSVGGGGLMNGIMQVIDEKGWADRVDVVAMETLGADSLNKSLQAGELVTLPRITSQATSLGVSRVSQRTFDYAQRPNVKSVVLSDAEAAKGCCILAEHERMMVELTVGVNIPILYDGRLQKILGSERQLNADSKVVIIVCGGNDISIEMLVSWRNMLAGEATQEVGNNQSPMAHATKVSA